jgi:hypothetical protein
MTLGQLDPLEPAPLEIVELEPVPQQTAPAVEAKYPPGTLLFVDASSLAMRTGPKRDSALIKYIPKDGRVTAIPDVLEPIEETIGGKKGQWLYIQHDQHKGYVFDVYLVEAPASINETMEWVCEPGKRVGPVSWQTTYEDLVYHFGQVNVSDTRIPIGDGQFEKGTQLFAGDPGRQILIQWAIYKIKPKAILVGGTKWRTRSGFGPGVSLAKLVELNGAPISFAGFEWEHAGFITDWQGGNLSKTDALREELLVYLSANQPYLPDDYKKLVGDVEFSSDLPEADRVNMKVSSMTIYVKEP